MNIDGGHGGVAQGKLNMSMSMSMSMKKHEHGWHTYVDVIIIALLHHCITCTRSLL